MRTNVFLFLLISAKSTNSYLKILITEKLRAKFMHLLINLSKLCIISVQKYVQNKKKKNLQIKKRIKENEK